MTTIELCRKALQCKDIKALKLLLNQHRVPVSKSKYCQKCEVTCMVKARVDGKEFEFKDFDALDSFLKDRNYARIVGNCNEWCVGKLQKIGNKASFYICGTIRDDKNQEIKATKGEK